MKKTAQNQQPEKFSFPKPNKNYLWNDGPESSFFPTRLFLQVGTEQVRVSRTRFNLRSQLESDIPHSVQLILNGSGSRIFHIIHERKDVLASIEEFQRIHWDQWRERWSFSQSLKMREEYDKVMKIWQNTELTGSRRDTRINL